MSIWSVNPKDPPSPDVSSDEYRFTGPIPAPDSPLRTSSSSPPASFPDKAEREGYYFGLPSCPKLLARSSSKIWVPPTGPYQHPEPKFLNTIGYRPKLQESWATMYPIFYSLLNRYKVLWTSIEAWLIGTDENDMAPILWIGIKPGTLTNENEDTLPIAGNVVIECRQVLRDHGIDDMECELKESESYRGASYGKPSTFTSPAVDIDVFFTSTIGTCISTPNLDTEGTFGFYLRFPAHPGKLFGVTCRHVLFDVDNDNKLFHCKEKSQRTRPVILPAERFLQLQQEKAKMSINDQNIIKEHAKREFKNLEGREGRNSKRARDDAESRLKKADKIIQDLEEIAKDMTSKWMSRESRTIGHVVFSPPIETTTNPKGFTADWCLYEVDEAKLVDFEGNVVDLGNEVSIEKLTNALNPNIRNPEGFKYPDDRQLYIQDNIVPIKEMYNPQRFDQQNQPAFSVGKRGRTTGVAGGVVNEIESYVRNYFSDGSSFVAKEMAVLGAAQFFRRFSQRGDSGALIWEITKRAAAMLTGGSGYLNTTDVTYSTPLEALFEDMAKYGWCNPTLQVVMAGGQGSSRGN